MHALHDMLSGEPMKGISFPRTPMFPAVEPFDGFLWIYIISIYA
jgi:hypothetical protein